MTFLKGFLLVIVICCIHHTLCKQGKKKKVQSPADAVDLDRLDDLLKKFEEVTKEENFNSPERLQKVMK